MHPALGHPRKGPPSPHTTAPQALGILTTDPNQRARGQMMFQKDQPRKTKSQGHHLGEGSCPQSLRCTVSSATTSLQADVNFLGLQTKPSNHQVPVHNHSFFLHCPFSMPHPRPGRALAIGRESGLISLRSESPAVSSLLGCHGWIGQDSEKGALRGVLAEPPGFSIVLPVYPCGVAVAIEIIFLGSVQPSPTPLFGE